MSTNPALAHELPAWCRGTGHELVASEADGDRRSATTSVAAIAGALMFADRPDWGLEAPDRRRRVRYPRLVDRAERA